MISVRLPQLEEKRIEKNHLVMDDRADTPSCNNNFELHLKKEQEKLIKEITDACQEIPKEIVSLIAYYLSPRELKGPSEFHKYFGKPIEVWTTIRAIRNQKRGDKDIDFCLLRGVLQTTGVCKYGQADYLTLSDATIDGMSMSSTLPPRTSAFVYEQHIFRWRPCEE